jgi:hypothetical protein
LNSGKFNTNARKIGNISGAFLKAGVGIHMEKLCPMKKQYMLK